MANWYKPVDEARAAWDAWLEERPARVREVAKRFPPWKLFRLHASDDGRPLQRVYVRSYGEPEEPDKPVTLTVTVDGRFNAVMMERNVFGIDPKRLTECDLPAKDEVVGSAGLSPEQMIQLMKRDES